MICLGDHAITAFVPAYRRYRTLVSLRVLFFGRQLRLCALLLLYALIARAEGVVTRWYIVE